MVKPLIVSRSKLENTLHDSLGFIPFFRVIVDRTTNLKKAEIQLARVTVEQTKNLVEDLPLARIESRYRAREYSHNVLVVPFYNDPKEIG